MEANDQGVSDPCDNCNHDRDEHYAEVLGSGCNEFNCACLGFFNRLPEKAVSPSEVPTLKVVTDPEMTTKLDELTSRVVALLDEFDEKVDFSEEPTGSLTLIFREVTAEEVRGILSGALKNNNKLYSMMYSTNDESEQNNG